MITVRCIPEISEIAEIYAEAYSFASDNPSIWLWIDDGDTKPRPIELSLTDAADLVASIGLAMSEVAERAAENARKEKDDNQRIVRRP